MSDCNQNSVTLGAPTIELGENRYLRHYIYEIFIGAQQELAGYVFSSRYFYRNAKNDRVLHTWMVRPDTYTEHNQQFMLDASQKYADLPVHIYENIHHDSGEIQLLDEVTTLPEFRGKGIENSAIDMWRNEWSRVVDALIVPDFGPMSRYIEGINTPTLEFWGKLNFTRITEDVMISAVSCTSKDQRMRQQ